MADDIIKWNCVEVEEFLKSKRGEFSFTETDIAKIKEQEVDGDAFLCLTHEILTLEFRIKYINAAKIMNLVKELNENQKKMKVAQLQEIRKTTEGSSNAEIIHTSRKSLSDRKMDKPTSISNARILVAIDFGITHSSFAYAHKDKPEKIVVNTSWPGQEGVLKTPTALQYDDEYKNVTNWGSLALEEEFDEVSDDRTDKQRPRPVKLFKLHISNLKRADKPWLPSQLGYKQAIEDYLAQMRKLIKKTLEKRWPTVIFPKQVDLVLTIPAEWPPHTAKVMRGCAYKAGLLTSLDSSQLEFTTESEAAALHCLRVIKEHNLQPSNSFLVADCGGDAVDLTSRKLLSGNKLSEIIKRVGDLCGSTFVDKEFLQWLGRKVGFQSLAKLKSNNYGQMQHLVQRFFCRRIKFKFNGERKEYKTLKLNLQQYCPDLPQYVTDKTEEEMKKVGWTLKTDFEAVKEMFDPVINRIIKLIGDQLRDSLDGKCSAMFLVGEFCECPYLFHRVKEAFKDQVPIIAVPTLPSAAIVCGAIVYGLDLDIVHDRV